MKEKNEKSVINAYNLGCSVKKVFQKIYQNSQEDNTCAEISF